MDTSTPRGPRGSSRNQTRRPRRIRKEVEEALRKVSKLTIKRLARRGGVKRISNLIYPEIRELLGIYVENLIQGSVEFCEYHRRKTITAADIVRTLKTHGHTLYGFDESPVPASVASDTPSMAAENSENEINENDETCIDEENSVRAGFNDTNSAHNSQRRANTTSGERPASDAASIAADNSEIDSDETFYEEENSDRDEDVNATSKTDGRTDTSSVQRPLDASSVTAEDSNIESMDSFKNVLNENITAKKVLDDVNTTQHIRADTPSFQRTSKTDGRTDASSVQRPLDATSVTAEDSNIESMDSFKIVLNEIITEKKVLDDVNTMQHKRADTPSFQRTANEEVKFNDLKDFPNTDNRSALDSVLRSDRATVSVMTEDWETENTDSVETVSNETNSGRIMLNDINISQNWDRNADTGVKSPLIKNSMKNKEYLNRNSNISDSNISASSFEDNSRNNVHTKRTSFNSNNNVQHVESCSENETDDAQNSDEIQFLQEISTAKINTNSTRSLKTSEQATNEVELIDIASEGSTANSSSLNSESVLSALNLLNDANCVPEVILVD